MRKFNNYLFHFRKTILGLGIFLSLLAVSVYIKDGSASLAWQNRPFLALLTISIGLFLLLLYMWINNHQIQQLSQQIQQQQKSTSQHQEKQLIQLTARQREVYDLIIDGKSNKEIIAELYIEQSTLKTHINQIYKKLKIKSRKELKNLGQL